jgi:hypothetical protein
MSFVPKIPLFNVVEPEQLFRLDGGCHDAVLRHVGNLRQMIADGLHAELQLHGLDGVAGRLGLAIHKIGEACAANGAVQVDVLGPLDLTKGEIRQYFAARAVNRSDLTLTPLGWRIHTIAQGFLKRSLDTFPACARPDQYAVSRITDAVDRTGSFWSQQRMQ